MRTEECDGAIGSTCAESGFYGDAMACQGCLRSILGCEACNPSDVACAAVGSFNNVRAAAASGSLIGVLAHGPLMGPTPLWAVDQLAKVASTSPTGGRTLVGVQNGWLVATSRPSMAFTFDAAGNVGTAHAIDSNDEVALAYAGGNRVLVAWADGTGPWVTRFELVDASGQVVFPKTSLFAGDGTPPGVTTDGTRFSAGSRGSLARIRRTGEYSVSSGFPGGAPVRLTWDGSTGWYVTVDSLLDTYVAQRFDSTGAPIGPVITLGIADDFLADGDDLLVARWTNTKLNVVRIAADGTELGSTEAGAGVHARALLVRTSGGLHVAWTWASTLRVAQIAAP